MAHDTEVSAELEEYLIMIVRVLCLMFVYVLCKFVSGLILCFLENLWFVDNLCK